MSFYVYLYLLSFFFIFFFFNDTATTEIYTLSLHDALPICGHRARARPASADRTPHRGGDGRARAARRRAPRPRPHRRPRAARHDPATAGQPAEIGRAHV